MANELVEQKKQKIAGYLSSDAVKANIMSVVGEKDAQMFISSVVSAVQTNPQLADCTNASILSAALLGHSLKLPHSPQLGYYWMVPYNNTKEINGKKVNTIASGAFRDHTELTSVTIPDSVTDIGDYAFEYCRSLTELTLGKNVKNIGKLDAKF